MIYPWQHPLYQQLWQGHQSGSLAHAWLFTGAENVGKFSLAMHFSRALLCQQATITGEPCGHCHSCSLVQAQTHPDILLVLPEKDGQAIKVDQIRHLSQFVSQSSSQGQYRVVIVSPAHTMNINASNALLKTLEEPASGAIIILISDQAFRLPATILSRCRRLNFPVPVKEDCLPWLEEQIKANAEQLLHIANGSPLLALKLSDQDNPRLRYRRLLYDGLVASLQAKQDVIVLASSLQDADLQILLSDMIEWLLDLLRKQLAPSSYLINHDYASALVLLAAKLDKTKCLRLLNEVIQLGHEVSSGIHFNKLLLLEGLIIRWVRCAI